MNTNPMPNHSNEKIVNYIKAILNSTYNIKDHLNTSNNMEYFDKYRLLLEKARDMGFILEDHKLDNGYYRIRINITPTLSYPCTNTTLCGAIDMTLEILDSPICQEWSQQKKELASKRNGLVKDLEELRKKQDELQNSIWGRRVSREEFGLQVDEWKKLEEGAKELQCEIDRYNIIVAPL